MAKLVDEYEIIDSGARKALKKLQSEYDAIDRKIKQATNSFNKGDISIEEYTDAIRKLNLQQGKFKISANSLVKDMVKVEKQAGRTAKKVGKGSSSGSASQALQELGRGASDARFGFAGLGNNLERFVEIMSYTIKQSGGLKGAMKALGSSLLGPGGIILGLTLLIAYGPEIVKFFRDWADSAGAAERAQDELNKKVDEGGLSVKEYFTELQSNAKKEIAGIIKELDSLDIQIAKFEEAGVDSQYTRGLAKRREELKVDKKELEDLNANLIDGLENQTSELLKAAAAARKYKARLAELKDQEDIAEFSIAAPGEGDKEDDYFSKKSLLERNVNPNILGDGLINPDDVDVIEDYDDAIQDLEDTLKSLGSAYYGLTVAQSEAWAKADADFNKAKVSIEDVSGALIGAFESAATQGGNVLKNLATGILSTIGSLLVKEGTAYVALGIARNAAHPGSGSGVIKTGIGLVAAGATLKAAGSAGSRSGGGGGSGGGSSSAGSRPVAQNVDTTSSNVKFEIGNNKLIGSLQQGLNKRGTTHGSSTLFP